MVVVVEDEKHQVDLGKASMLVVVAHCCSLCRCGGVLYSNRKRSAGACDRIHINSPEHIIMIPTLLYVHCCPP